MSVVSLREAISKRADELMVPALMAAGLTSHKRAWRTCDCTWCAKKREATAAIANMAGVPAYRLRRGFYVDDMRNAYRDKLRAGYRQKLRALENEEPF